MKFNRLPAYFMLDWLPCCSTLPMGATCSSETPVNFQRTARHCIPEDKHFITSLWEPWSLELSVVFSSISTAELGNPKGTTMFVFSITENHRQWSKQNNNKCIRRIYVHNKRTTLYSFLMLLLDISQLSSLGVQPCSSLYTVRMLAALKFFSVLWNEDGDDVYRSWVYAIVTLFV